MEWQSPQYLYLILPACVGWLLLALYSEHRRRRACEAFVAPPMSERILPETSRFRFGLKLAIRELAIITGLIALARPCFGTHLEKVVPRGSDLYVLMDVSRSMLADDVSPSRLDRARADVSALVNRLEGERIGLIAFAGQAVVKCPLTVDYDSFRRALEELDPESAPRGGTAIGDAIRKAIEVFSANSERDQAVLLITDGDDQESYPLEAAAVAAERKVTIFTVGLGDATQGARVPQKSNSSTYIEHEGQQVWSKLDGQLLREIALRTSGVYIPAGTRAYDLGDLYATHLQGRHGNEDVTQQRIRKSERFQIFLAICLVCLVVDLCFSVYRPRSETASGVNVNQKSTRPGPMAGSSIASIVLPFIVLLCSPADANADDSSTLIRQGLKHYQQEKFEDAGKDFAAANAVLAKSKSAEAAVAAFDEACAWHRHGSYEKARELYLEAGLSPERKTATAAHFNLGTMTAEKARTLAGENPEEVPVEKRQEILNELQQAVASYRHCLELQPDHVQSRRNLELVRSWIKYYSDRWRARDRQKIRDESSLIQFLDFLMTSQKTLRETVTALPETAPANAFAELKRAQDELIDEIPTLSEKIAEELSPPETTSGSTAQSVSLETQEGISLLQGWADQAGDKMKVAARELEKARSKSSIDAQQAAFDQLDQILDAVIPFHPLLGRELRDQSAVVSVLSAEPTGDAPDVTPSAEVTQASAVKPSPEVTQASEASPGASSGVTDSEANESKVDSDAETSVESAVKELPVARPSEDSPPGELAVGTIPEKIAESAIDETQRQVLIKSQETVLRKARLLAPKAEAELSRLESQSAPAADESVAGKDPEVQPDHAPDASEPDPEALKVGYRKAIELAPSAVHEMEAAVDALMKKDDQVAGVRAEEARRILEEIQQAQPKQDSKDESEDDKQNEDGKDEKDQEKNSQDSDDSNKDKQDKEQSSDDTDQKQDEQKKHDESKNQDSKDENSKSDQKSKGQQKDGDQKQKSSDQESAGADQPQQISRDRLEDALRRVRERQQQKRERDRAARARVTGRASVEKDW